MNKVSHECSFINFRWIMVFGLWAAMFAWCFATLHWNIPRLLSATVTVALFITSFAFMLEARWVKKLSSCPVCKK